MVPNSIHNFGVYTIYANKWKIKISAIIFSVSPQKFDFFVAKVFGKIDFGHFFCPILKNPNTFGHKKVRKMT
jgi:hypothetical protein